MTLHAQPRLARHVASRSVGFRAGLDGLGRLPSSLTGCGRLGRRARQAPLRALVKGPTTIVPPLDQVLAEAAGVLCGRAGTSDIIDASVVLVARREHAVMVTSDVEDLRHLDADLRIERI